MTKITGKQKKYLKGLAHKLNPVVMVGNKGVSEAVLKEIDATLEAHELIKIRVRCEDQVEFQETVAEIEEKANASLIQAIGHSVVLYREAKEAVIKLPN